MHNETANILEEVKKVINGKDEVIKAIWTTILAGGHVLLEDQPGVGKTTLAKVFSIVLGLQSKRIQFTPDVVASDVIGFTMFNKEKNAFVFKEGAVMCNLLLADEINRTSSRTQAALLEAMQEGHVTVDGETYTLPAPFHVIATQNPFGSIGTQPLPLAQLDRFMTKLSLGYPQFEDQVAMLRNRQKQDPTTSVQPLLTTADVRALQKEVDALFIHDTILRYITALTEATRNDTKILQGISPRGALAMCQMAKAHAFTEGRAFVLPQDVQAIWEMTCSHRIVLAASAQKDDAKAVLRAILQAVQTPDEAALAKV